LRWKIFLSSERHRLTVELGDSVFRSGEYGMIGLVPLIGRFRSEFPDSTCTPNRLRSRSCLQLKQPANYICQGTKRFIFRRALRTPPFRKYRSPPRVPRLQPMRHVWEAIATLRLDQTRPHSRRPCAL